MKVQSKNRRKGFACINNSKRLEKIVEYFTKYISKSFEDERLKNKKKYFNYIEKDVTYDKVFEDDDEILDNIIDNLEYFVNFDCLEQTKANKIIQLINSLVLILFLLFKITPLPVSCCA